MGAASTLGAIHQFALLGDEEVCFATAETLAKHTEHSERSMDRYFRILDQRGLGLIHDSDQGSRRSFKYGKRGNRRTLTPLAHKLLAQAEESAAAAIESLTRDGDAETSVLLVEKLELPALDMFIELFNAAGLSHLTHNLVQYNALQWTKRYGVKPENINEAMERAMLYAYNGKDLAIPKPLLWIRSTSIDIAQGDSSANLANNTDAEAKNDGSNYEAIVARRAAEYGQLPGADRKPLLHGEEELVWQRLISQLDKIQFSLIHSSDIRLVRFNGYYQIVTKTEQQAEMIEKRIITTSTFKSALKFAGIPDADIKVVPQRE